MQTTTRQTVEQARRRWQDKRAGVLRLRRQVHLVLRRARVQADLPITQTEITFQTSLRLFARSVQRTSNSGTKSHN
jgi:hypothetical protein